MRNVNSTFLLFIFLSTVTFNQAIAERNLTLQFIDSAKTHFLKTRGPKNKKLICFLTQDKPTLGIDAKLSSAQVSYHPFKPKTGEKKIAQAALKECRKLLLAPACKDRCDNDGDGAIDFPNDVGCDSATDDDETSTSSTLALCNDGIDNDGDGRIDYAEDVGCQSIGDNDEFNQPEQLNEFSVFRKPFADEHPVASMFDHKYPQEFVHADGESITHNNEVTTIGQDGHQGYDYAMDEGTELLATYDGTVIFAGTETPFFCPPLNATVSGNVVIIRHQIHDEQFDSIYGHLSSVAVTNGQVVTKGDLVGLSGNTGCSTGPHLHFDIRRRTNTNGGSPSSIDPSGWIGNSPDPWEEHASGTKSFRLWSADGAPKEYRSVAVPPNPLPSNSAAVAITVIRWAGSLDDLDPNNEYVELTIDPRYYPSSSYPLGGATLRNNKNEKFTFPDGMLLQAGKPLRIYSGSGINSSDELYWGRSTGAWDNSGDCAHLIRPTGITTYALRYGSGSCTSLGATGKLQATIVDAVEIKEIESNY